MRAYKNREWDSLYTYVNRTPSPNANTVQFRIKDYMYICMLETGFLNRYLYDIFTTFLSDCDWKIYRKISCLPVQHSTNK